MIGKLLRSEQSAALVAALSATIVVLMAKGDGPLSPDRIVKNVLPDPVGRHEARVGQPYARR
jgi:hypothetical protein